MKIIPLVLLLGATPALAQSTPAEPQSALELLKANEGRGRKKAKPTPAPKAAATPKATKAAKATPTPAPKPAKAEEQQTKATETEAAQKTVASTTRRANRRRAPRPPRPVVTEAARTNAAEETQPAAQQPAKAATARKPAPEKTEKTTKAERKAARPARKARQQTTAQAQPQPQQAPAAGEAPAQEQAAPRKRGGNPFSFIGRLFGGGKKRDSEATAEAANAINPTNAIVGPPAPTPAPARSRGNTEARPEPARFEQEDAHAELLQQYQEYTPTARPPIAVHRTVTNAQGEVVPADSLNDLPTHATPAPSAAPARTAQTPPAPAAKPFDRDRYQATRSKAADDPAISTLGEKLNALPPGNDEHVQAARAYTTALFGKMRELDPEQTDWINRMEAATIRRIDAGKPVFAE